MANCRHPILEGGEDLGRGVLVRSQRVEGGLIFPSLWNAAVLKMHLEVSGAFFLLEKEPGVVVGERGRGEDVG